MRILILTQYYTPEMGAPQNRLSDLARRLTIAGHTITVLTALPNYPRGEIFEGYEGHVLMEEQVEGLRVIRTWIYATKHKGFVQRLLNYFSFVCTSFALGIWKVGQQDVVVVESPPLFLGISALLLSRLKRAKLVFNVSDLWPESAVAMGILRNRTLIRLSTWLEEFLYRQSHLITGQTQGIIDNIRVRVRGNKVFLITNGVNVETFLSASTSSQADEVRKEFGLEEKFVIGYAGLHGLAQGLETIIHAASLLTQHQDLLFAFFGEGPEKEKLVRLSADAHLTNIRFYPTQPASRMSELISTFDIAIIPLKRLDLFKGALPSKIFEAMAGAVPIIASIDGEARALVEKARAGICIEPENPQAMADAIVQLYNDPSYRKTLGENGRRYVIEHYNRRSIAEEFERLILIAQKGEIDGSQISTISRP
jgi:glycosyltransferase involved in cell wall biosynthesis